MHYKHRWYFAFIVSFLVFACGYFFIIKRDWNHFNALCAKKVALQKQLIKITKPSQKHIEMKSNLSIEKVKKTLLADILLLAKRNKLKINTLHMQKMGVKLIMRGDASTLFAFIIDLQNVNYQLMLTRFTFKSISQSDDVLLTLNIKFFSTLMERKTESLHNNLLNNPFCKSTDPSRLFKANNSALSITEMKMVGVMQRDKSQIALLMSPYGSLSEITVGSKVGKENALVVAIKANQILFLLPHKKYFRLHFH